MRRLVITTGLSSELGKVHWQVLEYEFSSWEIIDSGWKNSYSECLEIAGEVIEE